MLSDIPCGDGKNDNLFLQCGQSDGKPNSTVHVFYQCENKMGGGGWAGGIQGLILTFGWPSANLFVHLFFLLQHTFIHYSYQTFVEALLYIFSYMGWRADIRTRACLTTSERITIWATQHPNTYNPPDFQTVWALIRRKVTNQAAGLNLQNFYQWETKRDESGQSGCFNSAYLNQDNPGLYIHLNPWFPISFKSKYNTVVPRQVL